MEILLLSLLPVIFLIGSAVVTNKAVSRGAKRKKAVILQLLSFAAGLGGARTGSLRKCC